MARKARVLACAVCAATAALASAPASAQSGSYDDFLAGLYQEFNDFRSKILADYDKWLDGEWVEYEPLKGKPRLTVPKPETMPTAETDAPQPSGTIIVEAVSDEDGSQEGDEFESTAPIIAAEDRETNAVAVYSVSDPMPSGIGRYPLNWYGMTIDMPDVDLSDIVRKRAVTAFGKRWKRLNESKDAHKLVRAIKTKAAEMGLNDYLTYDLVTAYVTDRYADAHSTSQASLIHFIMANLGYDVRLAKSGDGDGVMLLNTRQMIYSRDMMNIEGKRYFIFAMPGHNDLDRFDRISTCRLPKGSKLGDHLDLQLSQLTLPEKPYHFDITDGKLRIQGDLNENMINVLYRYPQMHPGEYALSVVDQAVRDTVVKQLGRQLTGRGKRETVDSLLQFVQKAFVYETDQKAHGFEKPYFFEEVLFHPTCDCEDRAVFYTYLLWNVLGVPNHLIGYPGHEAASVCLDIPLEGVEYKFKGRDFFISDPTYIGASTGMCMSPYLHTKPKVDHEYE